MLFEIKFKNCTAVLPPELQSRFMPLMTDSHFIATSNLERSFSLYTLQDWATLELTIQRLPNSHEIVRRIQRMIIANATQVTQDAQGRIRFPYHLLDYANIESTAIAIAFDHKLEIWNPMILRSHIKLPDSVNRNTIMNIRKYADESSAGLFSKYLCADVQAELNKLTNKIK